MKQMYSDPNLKDMLNPDAYNDLHREMQDAGIVTGEKTPTHTVSVSNNHDVNIHYILIAFIHYRRHIGMAIMVFFCTPGKRLC